MKILTNILNPIDTQITEYLDNQIVFIDNGKIKDVYGATKQSKKNDTKDYSNSILLPGLIDAHAHLPQLHIIGNYGNSLLEWLNDYAYTSEIHFENTSYAQKISKEFFKQLKKYGTTTAVIYSSIHKDSTEVAFKEAEKSKLRIFMGKTIMDQNCPSELCENPIQTLRESYELNKTWHLKKPNLQYIYSPRFAINTSPELIKEAAKTSRLYKTFLQTHLNESKEENIFLKKIEPQSKNFTEIYNYANALGPKTLLAHCIHNSKEEMDLIAETNSNIIHCPDSNFFLNSGTFSLKEFQKREINIGLGSDVGAGTTLDMFEIMKSMIYMQKELIPISTPFYYATLGNAKILSIDNDTGSIEGGKEAKFLKIDTNEKTKKPHEILNNLIFRKNYTRELISEN